MNYLYIKGFSFFGFFMLFLCLKISAQCTAGSPGGTTVYDTTITFETGATSIPVKFSQFDPRNGVVTCVRLCVTITGIIDLLELQNLSASAQTGSFNYLRNDDIVGPGITTALNNSANLSFGPISLSAYDGVRGAGGDFYSVENDTVLERTLCRTISDETTIVQFYGQDSVEYNYNINVSTSASVTGGSSSSLILTSALVNFHFEYCTCPGAPLANNPFLDFQVAKLNERRTQLNWQARAGDNLAYYEVEISRNGTDFIYATTVPKQINGDLKYSFGYEMREAGFYYFRLKMVENSGKKYISEIKTLKMLGNYPLNFSIFPNPSANGTVGIKFADVFVGKYKVLINNAQGQIVANREIAVNGNSYHQVATLAPGFYWVKVIEASTQHFKVNQLFIK